MHGRLIDADALRFEIINKPSKFKATEATIDFLTGLSKRTHEVLDILDESPTVDAVPVRHGRWETSEDDYYGLYIIKCSLCREVWCFKCDDDVFDLNYHYCPNCGAKMDGGTE